MTVGLYQGEIKMKTLCSIALVLILSSTAEFAFAQAGGVSGAVQYNKAGTLGGDTGFTTNGAGVLTETGTLPLTGVTKGVVTFNPTISLTSTLPTGTNPAGILGTAYLSGNGAYQNGNDTLGYLFDTNFYGTGTWALGKGLQEGCYYLKGTWTDTNCNYEHFVIKSGVVIKTLIGYEPAIVTNAGTVTGFYGFYNPNNSAAGAIPNNYAFYNSDPNAKMYTAGTTKFADGSTYTRSGGTVARQLAGATCNARAPELTGVSDKTTGVCFSKGTTTFAASGSRAFGLDAGALFANNPTGPRMENRSGMGTAVLIPNRAAVHAGLGSSTAGTPAIYGSNGTHGSAVDVADFAYSGVKFNKPVKFTKPVNFENASGTPVSYACFTASGALVSSMTPCVRDMVVSRR